MGNCKLFFSLILSYIGTHNKIAEKLSCQLSWDFIGAIVSISLAAFIPQNQYHGRNYLEYCWVLLQGYILGYGISDGRAREIIIESAIYS